MITREVILEVEGIKIAGQLYLPREGKHATVCICHGIPSGFPPDPGDRGYPALAEQICLEGFAVFIFNFRGTGNSGGNLDILAWTLDLESVINYLWELPEIDRTHLSLLGYSGGAAVSVYVTATDKRVSDVIACACPAEFQFFIGSEGADSVIEHFRGIGAIRDNDFPDSPEEWLKGFETVKPIKYVPTIAPRSLLLVHGNNDDVVDVGHARKLYTAAGEPKKLAIIEGGGHRLRRNREAVTIVTDWLKSRLLK